MGKLSWKNVKNILCVRLDNVGDIIMTSPAISAIKQSHPQATITLLTSSIGSKISPFLPMIDDTIVLNAPWMKSKKPNKYFFSCIRKIQQMEFDAGVCFTNFSQSCLPEALLLYLADIPLRLGYCRENPHELLTDWVPDSEPFEGIKHGVQRQLNLVEHIGATAIPKLYLKVKKNDIQKVKGILSKNGITSEKPFLVVHPGVSDEKRRFSLDILGLAVRELTKSYQIVLTGTNEEKELIEIINTYAPSAIALCNLLTMGQFIALISLSDLLLSNNTGPVHIAASVATPVVVLYARTNPEHTPWGVPHQVLYFDIPQQQITRNQILNLIKPTDTINEITSLDIVFAVESLLQQTLHSRNKSLYV